MRWWGNSAVAIVAIAAFATGMLRSQAPTETGPPKTYAENCAGCHGANMSGGRGPSLSDERFLAAHSDDQLRQIITHGKPGTEMPAFGATLSQGQIWQLVSWLRMRPRAPVVAPPYIANPDGQIVRTAKQSFRIRVVAKDLVTPWGLAFLPDGRLLVTERPGRLRIVDRAGHLDPTPVSGLPAIHIGQDAGLLDVAIPPDYARSGWIYLSYSDAQPAQGQEPVRSMTVLIRGKLDAHNRWTETQTIFRAPPALYTTSGSHYGSRFLFDGKGHVFFSIGERGEMRNAQDLSTPLGKIHRVNLDGSIPADNPFVHTPGAMPSIWSYGHRNPEGLAWNPQTGDLWEAEHGPWGGDEINVIQRGHNYGWGVVSMGIQPGIKGREAPGMDPPIAFYTPTIAPSGIHFYTGSRYPGWKNGLFVTGLAGHQLRRLETSGRAVTGQEKLFDQLGRIRAVTTGPDGLLYVLTQTPTGEGTGVWLSESTPGMLIRLVPIKDAH